MADWSDLRLFLEVVRTGTLAAAARNLAVDSTTIGRRISALEKQLGARLFARTPDGLLLTGAGEAMRQAGEEMEQAILRGEQRAQGADKSLSGRVRVATTETLGEAVVLPALLKLHAEHPQIRVDLISGPARLDLARREADIALRYVRPESGELVAKRIGSVAFAPYASKKYLAARGRPARGSGFAGHDLISFDAGIRSWRDGQMVGESIESARTILRVNSSMMILRAVKLGLGIGPVPCLLTAGEKSIERVLPALPPELDELWLVVHADLQRTRRVRVVIEAIAARLKEIAPQLAGG